MDIDDLRQVIEEAILAEQAASTLESHLKNRLRCLHHSIHFSRCDSVRVLHDFVVRYARHVPDFLEALTAYQGDFLEQELVDPLVAIGVEFFAQSPSLFAGHSGMLAIMDRSYLAHRLLEEINCLFIGRFGRPLAPMDMTRSNLIVHNLIGEPFANQLDEKVELIVARLQSNWLASGLDRDTVARVARSRAPGVAWPCFTANEALDLLFATQEPKPPPH